MQVNIHEAKAKLSELVERATRGEEIVIAKRNVPVVRLQVINPVRPSRALDWASGKIRMADDFDDPLDDFAEYT